MVWDLVEQHFSETLTAGCCHKPSKNHISQYCKPKPEQFKPLWFLSVSCPLCLSCYWPCWLWANNTAIKHTWLPSGFGNFYVPVSDGKQNLVFEKDRVLKKGLFFTGTALSYAFHGWLNLFFFLPLSRPKGASPSKPSAISYFVVLWKKKPKPSSLWTSPCLAQLVQLMCPTLHMFHVLKSLIFLQL